MSTQKLSQSACIAARWFWIVIYALIGVLTSGFIAPIFQKYVLPPYNTLYYSLGWNKWEIFGIPLAEYDFLLIVLLVGLLIARPPMPKEFWQLKNWKTHLQYPSIFWSILLGGIMISLSFNAWMWVMVLTPIGIIFFIIHLLKNEKLKISRLSIAIFFATLIIILLISSIYFLWATDVSPSNKDYWLYARYKQLFSYGINETYGDYLIILLKKVSIPFQNPSFPTRLGFLLTFFLPTFFLSILLYFLGYQIKRMAKEEKNDKAKTSDYAVVACLLLIRDNPRRKELFTIYITGILYDIKTKLLLEWLQSDDSIEKEEGDRFHYKEHAKHLADYLQNNKSHCLTILGGHGSGKTSLTNLIKENLRENKEIIFITIQTWASDNYKNTISIILDGIINELAKYIEVAGLRDVTKKYLESILERNSSLWAFFTRIFTRHASSDSVLRRISKALVAINKTIYVVIEDIDRNIIMLNGDSVHHSDRAQKAKEAFEGFLYELKGNENISYILNIDPRAYEYMDLQKLSDKTFLIPKIKPKYAVNVYMQLRKYLMDESKEKGDIDPCSLGRYIVYEHELPDHVLAYFLEYPRTLKLALRNSLKSWEENEVKAANEYNSKKPIKLHGEIDIDHLLLLNMLQERCPIIFAKYLNYQYYIAEDYSRNQSHGVGLSDAEFDDIIKRTGYEKEYIQELFQHLDRRFTFTKPITHRKPYQFIQGMEADTWEVSYFERAILGYVPTTEISDQQILKFLENPDNTDNLPKGHDKEIELDSAIDKRISRFLSQHILQKIRNKLTPNKTNLNFEALIQLPKKVSQLYISKPNFFINIFDKIITDCPWSLPNTSTPEKSHEAIKKIKEIFIDFFNFMEKEFELDLLELLKDDRLYKILSIVSGDEKSIIDKFEEKILDCMKEHPIELASQALKLGYLDGLQLQKAIKKINEGYNIQEVFKDSEFQKFESGFYQKRLAPSLYEKIRKEVLEEHKDKLLQCDKKKYWYMFNEKKQFVLDQ